MRTSLRLLVLVASLLATNSILALGADPTSPERVHPSLAHRKPLIHRIVLLPARVEMFEVQAGGMEKMEDWAADAKAHLLASLQDHLKAKASLTLDLIEEGRLAPDQEQALSGMQSMYEAVRQSIVQHTYPGRPDNPVNHLFDHKVDQFDYSLGEDVRALSKDAHAYLAIQVLDYRRSKGLIALQAGAMIAGALLGVVPVPRGMPTESSLSLIDAETGDILWFYRFQSAYDVRDRQGADQLLDEAFRSFPLP